MSGAERNWSTSRWTPSAPIRRAVKSKSELMLCAKARPSLLRKPDRVHQGMLLRAAEARNEAQLLRVADDDGLSRPGEHRQRRGDVALAGFVEDRDVEEPRDERHPRRAPRAS